MRSNYQLAVRALLIALIFIQTTVPGLGYVPIGPLSLTIIPITVVIAAVMLGIGDGMLIGGVWGMIAFIRAFFWPTSPLAQYVFVNPIVSVLPRILIGLFAGVAFAWLCKTKVTRWRLALVGLVGSLTNTVFLLGFVALFYREHAQLIYHINTDALLPYLLTVLATNGVLEALLAAVIVPLIAMPLLKRIKHK